MFTKLKQIKMPTLSLFHKGIILVCAPLLFELIFIVILTILLQQAEHEADVEARSKAIIAKVDALGALFMEASEAIGIYSITRNPELRQRYAEDIKLLPEEMAELKHLVKGNPRQEENLRRVEANTIEGMRWLNRIENTTTEGLHLSAMVGRDRVYRELKSLVNRLQTDLKSFIEEEHRNEMTAPKASRQARQLLYAFLWIGTIINVALALTMAYLFYTSISKRLQTLTDNTHRLAKNQELNERLAGDDEIAQLDEVFHEMADRLQVVARLKKEFVSTVSHELRTPLTSIRGSLSLLSLGALGALSEQAQKAVKIAERNTVRLINLINDLLDIEKLEAGKLELVFENVPFSSVLERSLESVKAFGEQYKVQVDSEQANNNANVHVDGDRIVQVLVNLLSNAIKYSPQNDKVIVTATANGQWLKVAVVDHGKGVPDDFKAKIFERFQQVEAADAKQKGGTGLGLAICKSIIEQHGGKIDVDSVENQGSTFWFTIPLTPVLIDKMNDTLSSEKSMEKTATEKVGSQ